MVVNKRCIYWSTLLSRDLFYCERLYCEGAQSENSSTDDKLRIEHSERDYSRSGAKAMSQKFDSVIATRLLHLKTGGPITGGDNRHGHDLRRPSMRGGANAFTKWNVPENPKFHIQAGNLRLD